MQLEDGSLSKLLESTIKESPVKWFFLVEYLGRLTFILELGSKLLHHFSCALFKAPQICAKYDDALIATRDVTRLDGARGNKQVWRPHVRNWGFAETNVLYWRQYLWHRWDFLAPAANRRRPQWFGAPWELLRPPPRRYAPDCNTSAFAISFVGFWRTHDA